MSWFTAQEEPFEEDAQWDAPQEPVQEGPPELGPVVYRVLTGVKYHGKKAEAGDLVDDLPEGSVEWLLNDGHIEKAEVK